MVLEMKIIKEELRFEENLKKRLEFICEFSKVTPTFVNGSIRKIEKTNISYIEPHRVIVKDTIFLVFNYSNDVYISNLAKKIKLSELEDYIKQKYNNIYLTFIKILCIINIGNGETTNVVLPRKCVNSHLLVKVQM